MQLQLSTWPDVEAYLARSKAILIPIGSTEQHGPNGLLGTDALCPEIISRRAGDEAGILVGPTFNVGQAQHHMGFAGTITLRPSTMIAAMLDWTQSLTRHGFERLYWLNGHGGNIATITAAFSEMYHGVTFSNPGGGNRPPLRCHLRNWWELPGVMDLCRQLFPVGESDATPSEVSVTWAGYPEAVRHVPMSPRIAPDGPILDAEDYRRRFPDGRIGSDPSQASIEAGEKIVTAAVKGVISEFRQFSAGSAKVTEFLFPPVTSSLAVVGNTAHFPVRRVWCVGRNYLAHVREMGNDEREPPFFFSKQPDMVVPGGMVRYPGLTKDLHHEVELVVALKSGGREIAAAKAMDCVFGYAVGIDLTRREQQNAAKAKGKPWEIAKSFEQSGPCGALTPAGQAGDIARAAITLTVNGAPRQHSSIAHMIWNIGEIIAHLSEQVDVAAGDVIFTGTPEGVGAVVRGDRLEARIAGLEPLSVTIA